MSIPGIPMRAVPALLLFILTAAEARGQLYDFPTGANRSEVGWQQIQTEHFTIVYHDGLDSAARQAAAIAEAVYPVVTGNLRTEIPGRTLLYLSDLDQVANAFAYGDRFIFIWMRGILDDMSLGGVRSAGHAKWLRAVITHEFTHTVIAHAAGTWASDLLPFLQITDVPRWFNEGTARFLEPDGWTTDLDMVLRVAAVNGSLGYSVLLEPDAIDGTLLYETGHSLVRYMTARFGDSVLAAILDHGRGAFGFDFNQGVRRATGMTMGEIYSDWFRSVTALYGAEYAGRAETEEIAPSVTKVFPMITSIRYSPDRQWIAILGGDLGTTEGALGQRLYLMRNDSTSKLRRLSDEPAIDDEFSWSPDGRQLVLSKLRRGAHRALLSDLYILDSDDGDMRRLTDNASLLDPAWSPGGEAIVAVRKRAGRDNLVLVNPADGGTSPVTSFTGDVQIYTPVWSPDGSRIAFSLFDEDGVRAIAVVNRDGTGFRRLVADTSNNRYPVWSPDGSRIAFTTHAGGVPNLQVMNADGSGRRYLTDVAGGLYSVQWLPGSDSVVAISLDTRRRLLPHLIPAGQQVTLTPSPSVRPKHGAWRSAAPALHVPPADSIAPAPEFNPEGYLSLAHLFPMVPLLPQLGDDITGDGTGGGARYGLGSLWADPMGKHILFGVADYGTASKEWGGELYYINNQLPVSLALHGRRTLGFERRLEGYSYYQRNTGARLEGSYLLPAPNSLSIAHRFRVGVGYFRHDPWAFDRRGLGDPANGVPTPLPIENLPQREEMAEAWAGYRFSSRTLLAQARYTRLLPNDGEGMKLDEAIDRLHGVISFRYPIFGSNDLALLLRAEGAADFGPVPVQDRLAIESYQLFRHRWTGVLDLMAGEGNFMVRGVRATIPGDRLLLGSLGLQTHFPILEDYLPLLSYLSPQTVLFIESGTAWESGRETVRHARFASSLGAELRTEVLPDLWLSGGVAWGIGPYHGEGRPYLRLLFGR